MIASLDIVCRLWLGTLKSVRRTIERRMTFWSMSTRDILGSRCFHPRMKQCPVWHDAERFVLEVEDWNNPAYSWSHRGIELKKACMLRRETLRDVRWKNDAAVPFLWQTDYQTPLLPHRSATANYRVEKLVERLAFHAVDFASQAERDVVLANTIAQLRDHGVYFVSA